MTPVVAAQRGQPQRSSGKRTGWQMITMTAAMASGPISSRAYETPASAITAAARPRRIRSVGDSEGAAAPAGADVAGGRDCFTGARLAAPSGGATRARPDPSLS